MDLAGDHQWVIQDRSDPSTRSMAQCRRCGVCDGLGWIGSTTDAYLNRLVTSHPVKRGLTGIVFLNLPLLSLETPWRNDFHGLRHPANVQQVTAASALTYPIAVSGQLDNISSLSDPFVFRTCSSFGDLFQEVSKEWAHV